MPGHGTGRPQVQLAFLTSWVKDGGPPPPDLVGLFLDDVAPGRRGPCGSGGPGADERPRTITHHPIREAIFEVAEARSVVDVVNPYIANESSGCSGRLRAGRPRSGSSSRRATSTLPLAAFRASLAELLEAGVTVVSHPGMAHAKIYRFDQRLLIGSCNLDDLSLYRNDELDLGFEGRPVPALAEPVFEELIAASTPAVPSTAWPARTWSTTARAVVAMAVLSPRLRSRAPRRGRGGVVRARSVFPPGAPLPGAPGRAILGATARRDADERAERDRAQGLRGRPVGRPARSAPDGDAAGDRPGDRAVAAIGGSAWIVAASWPAVVPFIVGGLVTYELLPVVDALDRVMPRTLAAIPSVLAVVAVVVGIGVLVLPPLANVFVRYAADLPTAADIDAAVARFQQQLATLPDGSTAILIPVLTSLASTVREAFSKRDGRPRRDRPDRARGAPERGGSVPRPDRPADLDARSPDPEAPRADRGRQPDHAVAATGRLGGGLDRRPAAGSYLRGYVVTAAPRRPAGLRGISSRPGSAGPRSTSRSRSRPSPA